VMGTDAVHEALLAGAPRLLLVAKDAAGRRDELVQQANVRRVPVVELSSKGALGHLTGKETLGFLAILDAHIAREIAASARWLAGLSEDG
jgi:ribosomal protein L7Ae-like RNA K-turn-binding protein